MMHDFTCAVCGEEQNQEMKGMLGDDLSYGGLGYVTCWSCGHQEWYQIDPPPNPHCNHEFWDAWMESKRIWKTMSEEERRKTYTGVDYRYSEENAFKEFHNDRRKQHEVLGVGK